MMWIEQIASVKSAPEMAKTLRDKINLLLGITGAMFWGGYIGGGVISAAMVTVLILLAVQYRKRRATGYQPLNVNDSEVDDALSADTIH
jgi:hypothetical protein